MEFKTFDITGLVEITPRRHGDERGFDVLTIDATGDATGLESELGWRALRDDGDRARLGLLEPSA